MLAHLSMLIILKPACTGRKPGHFKHKYIAHSNKPALLQLMLAMWNVAQIISPGMLNKFVSLLWHYLWYWWNATSFSSTMISFDRLSQCESYWLWKANTQYALTRIQISSQYTYFTIRNRQLQPALPRQHDITNKKSLVWPLNEISYYQLISQYHKTSGGKALPTGLISYFSCVVSHHEVHTKGACA